MKKIWAIVKDTRKYAYAEDLVQVVERYLDCPVTETEIISIHQTLEEAEEAFIEMFGDTEEKIIRGYRTIYNEPGERGKYAYAVTRIQTELIFMEEKEGKRRYFRQMED